METDFDDYEWPFGGEGGPDDVLVPSGVGSPQVSKLLSRADDHAGEYSFGGLADTLPVAPGLFVEGLGVIPTPLYPGQAETLIALCEKSPFGHNMETKRDDNVRKSWQLQPSHVQFKNPLWHTGIEKLTTVIADRLGYKGIPLECVLYKLLVYSEGGHFTKHQDTEKKDGMIATLVVQPPSLHEGGDLVVYRDGEVKYRHDFGKADGSAAYLPHYAVHYADAEHALEKVTEGYRLALVYSICLPSTMQHLERPHDKALSDDLASAISDMESDNDSFALLLDHEYTQNSIQNMGSGALKGVDSARFHALDGANAIVAEDKKLRFFFVQLEHEVHYYDCGDDGCDKEGHHDAITWYTVAGEKLGKVRGVTEKVNFLNPSQETMAALWDGYGEVTQEGGYTGNEGSTTITTYTRCAIVAWPTIKHPENAMIFFPAVAAAEALHSRKPVDGASLRQLVGAASNRTNVENRVKFLRLVCELLVETGDPEVAVFFFKRHCGALGGVEGNEALISSLTKIVRALDWAEIGQSILYSLGSHHSREAIGLSPLELTLRVIDDLDAGAAQQSLIEMAVDKATQLYDVDLFTSKSIGLLWKWVIRSGDKSLFDTIAEPFTNADSSVLGPSILYLSQYLSEDEKVTVLIPMVRKRVKWLKDEVGALDKKFSWEMPDAEFSANEKIQEFLRGPEVSMTTKGVETFKDLQDAQNYAAKYPCNEQDACSFEMEAAEVDDNAFVTITKTRKLFLTQQRELMQFQTELRLLRGQFGDEGTADGGEKKRIRLDE